MVLRKIAVALHDIGKYKSCLPKKSGGSWGYEPPLGRGIEIF